MFVCYPMSHDAKSMITKALIGWQARARNTHGYASGVQLTSLTYLSKPSYPSVCIHCSMNRNGAVS